MRPSVKIYSISQKENNTGMIKSMATIEYNHACFIII